MLYCLALVFPSVFSPARISLGTSIAFAIFSLALGYIADRTSPVTALLIAQVILFLPVFCMFHFLSIGNRGVEYCKYFPLKIGRNIKKIIKQSFWFWPQNYRSGILTSQIEVPGQPELCPSLNKDTTVNPWTDKVRGSTGNEEEKHRLPDRLESRLPIYSPTRA